MQYLISYYLVFLSFANLSTNVCTIEWCFSSGNCVQTALLVCYVFGVAFSTRKVSRGLSGKGRTRVQWR